HTHAQCDMKVTSVPTTEERAVCDMNELPDPKATTEERAVSPPTAANVTSKLDQSAIALSDNNKSKSNVAPSRKASQLPKSSQKKENVEKEKESEDKEKKRGNKGGSFKNALIRNYSPLRHQEHLLKPVRVNDI